MICSFSTFIGLDIKLWYVSLKIQRILYNNKQTITFMLINQNLSIQYFPLKIIKTNYRTFHIMFSLADEIQKFQNTILTLPDNVITLDERFFGGGIKMQDLIQQNHFIISQMRKFKAIFLNYCKLNDKIYNKIIQHQVNADQNFQKVYAISVSIDRKIEESNQQMKKTKQDITMQVNQLKQLIENNTKSFKVQTSKKVGEQNFQQRVKKIIQIYQQQNATSSMPSDNESKQNFVVNGNGNVSSIPVSNKKRKGLTLQDIQLFKAQITPLIDATNEKLNTQIIRISECTSNITIHNNKFQKVQQQIKWLGQDMSELRKNIEQAQTASLKQDKKIIEIMRQTINQNIWTQRFQNFNQKNLLPAILKLNDKFYKKVQDISREIDSSVKPKFIEINGELLKIRDKQKQIEKQIVKIQQKFPIIHTKIQQNKQIIYKKINQNNKKYEKQNLEQIAQHKNQMQKLQQNINNINLILKQMVNTVEEGVLKKVQYKLGKQIKEIKSDITALNIKASQINNNVKFNGQQVNHVKDVVATKANYTDLIVYFDKKADKQDFKELQELVIQSPKASHHNWTQEGQLKNQSLRRATQQKRKRKSPYSKRMTTPIYTKPEQDPSRFLLAGWETLQNKQSIKNTLKNPNQIQNSKRRNKIMRPSTANPLFLL